MDIINNLAKLANSLDQYHLQYMADDVDAISQKIFKVAKYFGDGIQGHWIRNERCWQQCYRSKRKSSPDKPAQEVWMDCLKEYQDSIGKSESAWDKYAGEPSSVKIAKADKLNKKFASVVKEKVSSGEEQGKAIFSILNEQINDPADCALECSEALVHLANRLSIIDGNLAKQASDISAEMMKMAQMQGTPGRWMNNFTNLFRGKSNKTNDLKQRYDKILTNIRYLLSTVPKNALDPNQKDAIIPNSQKIVKDINSFVNNIHQEANSLFNLSRSIRDPQLAQMVTQLRSGLEAIKGQTGSEGYNSDADASVAVRRKVPVLNQLLQSLQTSSNNYTQTHPTDPAAQADPAQAAQAGQDPAMKNMSTKTEKDLNNMNVTTRDPNNLPGVGSSPPVMPTTAPGKPITPAAQPLASTAPVAPNQFGGSTFNNNPGPEQFLPARNQAQNTSNPGAVNIGVGQGWNGTSNEGLNMNAPTAPQSGVAGNTFLSDPPKPGSMANPGFGTITNNPQQAIPAADTQGIATTGPQAGKDWEAIQPAKLSPYADKGFWQGKPRGLSNASVNSKGIKTSNIEDKKSTTKKSSGLVNLFKI